MKRKLFNTNQLQALKEAQSAIGDIDSLLATLKALGVDLPDREALNASRRAACERCLEVAAEYERDQQGH